jgi:hypothetical protein
VLVLEVLHDDVALHHHVERVEELEAAVDRRAVVEALRDHRAEPALELLDVRPEDVEVVVELVRLPRRGGLARRTAPCAATARVQNAAFNGTFVLKVCIL